jgi:hypothetical protein
MQNIELSNFISFKGINTRKKINPATNEPKINYLALLPTSNVNKLKT